MARRSGRSSDNVWQVGAVVRVGFCTLRVVELLSLPWNARAYRLASLDGTKRYIFTPYNGLTRD